MITNPKLSQKPEDESIINSIKSSSEKNVVCPFCGWQGSEFYPFGLISRRNAMCPQCGSLERHRLYYLYLKQAIPTDRKLKVLHFAPEEILTKLFRSYPNIDYLSADIDPEVAMVKEDITDLSFKDDTFDIIFCSNVLEHIEKDKLAIKEMYRVLKPGGFAIIQVPIKTEFNGRIITKTYEDPSITSPEEREKHFGLSDHVRIYGSDYPDRLREGGFDVTIDKFVESLPESVVKKYSLIRRESNISPGYSWIYKCIK